MKKNSSDKSPAKDNGWWWNVGASTIPESKRWPDARSTPYRNNSRPRLCPECDKTWQGGIIYFEYLDDFPKIGCVKSICNNCKGDNNEDNLQ